ncbi:hypothetical protein ACSBR2_042111 [Camellia fascicularis]
MPQGGEFEGNVNVGSQEGNYSPKDERRKPPRPDLRSVLSEIMKLQSDRCSETAVERLISGYVDKEVESALAEQKHPCNKKWDSGNEIQLSKSRSLQLQFLNKLSLPVLTGENIKGEENTSIGVALVDGLTGQVVNAGPEASAKVQIVVLDMDVNGYDGDNGTPEEFKNKIVGEREGQKLLKGDVYLNLKDGRGFMGNIYFKHTKCWMRKKEYRLAARIVGAFHGIEVGQARTEPFIIEDKRGKLYQKHHPPTLSDAVWRLEKIGKDGAFHKRLTEDNIKTVKDFVTLLNIDPERLKRILGGRMPSKMWDITVDHARTCILDKRAYLYCPPSPQQKTTVVFNVVGQLIGLLMEQQLISVDKLSLTEKDDAHNLVVSAFQHWEQVVLVDDEASLTMGSQQLANAVHPSNLTTPESIDSCNFDTLDMYGNAQQGTTDIISLGVANTLDDFGLIGVEELDYISRQPFCLQGEIPNSRICGQDSVTQNINYESENLFWSIGEEGIDDINNRYEQPLSFASQVTSPLICDTDTMIQAFSENELLQFSDNHHSLQCNNTTLQSQGDAHNAVNDIRFARSAAVTKHKAQRRYFSKNNAKRRWRMLFSIMRWFSVRRNVGKKNPFEEINELSIAPSRAINPSICAIEAVNSSNDHLESQANLHSAVNDILLARSAAVAKNKAQRPYLSKREKAQRRWRVLFSVMRWFSVKRNVAGKTRVREIPKNFSASSIMRCSNDDGFQSTGDMEHRYKQAWTFPSNVTKSMTGAFCEDNHLRVLDTHRAVQSQKSDLDPLANVDSAVDYCSLAHSSAVGMSKCKTHRRYVLKRSTAQKRWRMLFSVVRWFSVRRNVARKTSIEDIPFKLTNSSQHIMSFISSMGNMNSFHNDGLQSTGDTSNPNHGYEPSLPGNVTNSPICDTECRTQGFCQDEHLQVFNTHCSLRSQNPNLESQATLHDTVNDILLARSTAAAMNKAQRRYLSKRYEARRRWKILFSVVRWFSVRRNVAKKGHPLDMQRY